MNDDYNRRSEIRKPTAFDLGLIILLAASWGSTFVATKLAVFQTGVVWLVFYRAAIGCLTVLPFALYQGWQWPKNAKTWRLITALAFLNVTAPFFLLSWSQQVLPASTGALLTATSPMVGLLLAHFTTRDDKLNFHKMIAVVLGFSGVATVVGWDATRGLTENLPAQGGIILMSVCYSLAATLMRGELGLKPFNFSALVMGMVAVVFLPLSLLFQGAPQALDTQAIYATLYLGMIPTGLAYILRLSVVRRVGVSYFSHVSNLIPIFGIGYGALLLSEPITLPMIIAIALIFSGLAVARAGVSAIPAQSGNPVSRGRDPD
ncbi:MAG: DMT family transporter [Flavobacteriaceae bacterium]